MNCPTQTCSADVDPTVPHTCPGTKPRAVTREEFEKLRSALAEALCGSVTTATRDAAFARGATDALAIRVAALERFVRFTGVEQEPVAASVPHETHAHDFKISSATYLGQGKTREAWACHCGAMQTREIHCYGEQSVVTITQTIDNGVGGGPETCPAVTQPQPTDDAPAASAFDAALQALSCLIGTTDAVLVEVGRARSFTTRTVGERLLKAASRDNGGGGATNASPAPGNRDAVQAVDAAASASTHEHEFVVEKREVLDGGSRWTTLRCACGAYTNTLSLDAPPDEPAAAASALPPLPERPNCIDEGWLESWAGDSGWTLDAVVRNTTRAHKDIHRLLSYGSGMRARCLALEQHLAAAKATIARLADRDSLHQFYRDVAREVGVEYQADGRADEPGPLAEVLSAVAALRTEKDALDDQARTQLSAMTERAQRAEKRAEGMVTKEVALVAMREYRNKPHVGIDSDIYLLRSVEADAAALRAAETKETKS